MMGVQLPNHFLNRYQKVISILVSGISLLLLNMLFGLPNYAAAVNSSMQGSNSKSVFAHLQAAKVAQEAGQTEVAKSHWLHAKRLNPSLVKPAWLITEASAAFPVAIPERQLLLTQLPELSDSNRKEKLEEYLKANPLDAEIRSALLGIAKRQGDKAAEQRHQSVIRPETSSRQLTSLRFVLLVFLLGGLAWGIFAPLPGSNKQSPVQLLLKALANLMKSKQ